MPDHIHFLAEGTHHTSDLREFVRLFKQLTAFEFRKLRGKPLWEMSYYDHILRPTDSVEEVAIHIWWTLFASASAPRLMSFLCPAQTINWMKRSVHGTRWSPP